MLEELAYFDSLLRCMQSDCSYPLHSRTLIGRSCQNILLAAGVF